MLRFFQICSTFFFVQICNPLLLIHSIRWELTGCCIIILADCLFSLSVDRKISKIQISWVGWSTAAASTYWFLNSPRLPGLNFSSFWHGAAHGLHSLHLEEIRQIYLKPLFSEWWVISKLSLSERSDHWSQSFNSWQNNLYISKQKCFILRHFFEPNASENNKIPVVNKNFSSKQVQMYWWICKTVLYCHF